MTWTDWLAMALLVTVAAGLARGILREDHRRDGKDPGRW